MLGPWEALVLLGCLGVMALPALLAHRVSKAIPEQPDLQDQPARWAQQARRVQQAREGKQALRAWSEQQAQLDRLAPRVTRGTWAQRVR